MKLIIGCNDGHNGSFRGEFNQATITHKSGIEVDMISPFEAYPIEFNHATSQVVIARTVITYKAIRTWPGSWACEEMVISKKDGIGLLKLFQKLGFVDEEITGAKTLDEAIRRLNNE